MLRVRPRVRYLRAVLGRIGAHQRENLQGHHRLLPGLKFGAGPLALSAEPGNTKGGSITVPLTSCLTRLESAE